MLSIKEDLLRCCPDVTRYRVVDKTGDIVSEFLLNIADNITEFMFSYEHMSMETLTGLLHQMSLESVAHFHEQGFEYEKEVVPSISDHFRQSGRFLQLIPRGCSPLRILDLHLHEMDMDVAEVGKWTCKDLKTIRIRVKGLDTKEKILKAIHSGTDMSFEARVARHLLKFEKLWWGWLGYQTWTPI
ncbi:hypothetical protein BGW39_007700 [Mortierella sp. 14UC]|nr:hypothetical protein BGW39_007700 [Mortierella sp. 14UC]